MTFLEQHLLPLRLQSAHLGRMGQSISMHNSLWTAREKCMNNMKPTYDHCMSNIWSLYEQCIITVWAVCEHCMNSLWSVLEKCMTIVWTFSDRCMVTLWLLYGHSMTIVWAVYDHCMIFIRIFKLQQTGHLIRQSLNVLRENLHNLWAESWVLCCAKVICCNI